MSTVSRATLSFRNVGFVYITNHGIPEDKVKECFDWSAKFFSLPLGQKMLSPHPDGWRHHRGFSTLGREKASQHVYDEEELKKVRDVPDTKESFDVGHVDDAAQPNIWPPDGVIPGFRPFMEEFYVRCRALVHDLLHCLALALDMDDPEWLSSTHDQDLFQLRLLHYPAVAARALRDKERTRVGLHSDFGTLTLLFQDKVGGLEVEDPNSPGTFKAAPAVEGACLVNIGDLLDRWSNGLWRSTVHRVGAPPAFSGELSGGEVCPDRYSIPFFSVGNMEQVVEALPGCWSESNPKKHEPTKVLDYISMRMADEIPIVRV